MIDTITFCLNKPIIKKKNLLIIVPSKSNDVGELSIDRLLYIKENGESINGEKAYYNDDFINVDIINKNRYSENNNTVFVRTSIPKILGTADYILNKSTLKTLLTIISKRLIKIGIKTDLKLAKLSRLDFFIDLKTDYEYKIYKPIFDKIHLTRKKTLTEWDTTTLFKSRKKEIIFYDKIAEQKSKSKIKYNSSIHITRIESRYTSHKEILKTFGISTYDELYHNYQHVCSKAIIEMRHNLFKRKVRAMKEYFPDLPNLLKDYIKKGKRSWWNQFKKDVFFKVILNKYSLEEFKKILQGVTNDRTKIYRAIKELNTYKLNQSFNKKSVKGISYYDLYSEIEKKFSARGVFYK